MQRTLLDLEPGGLINADLAVQWDWMKQYRVWEANRKVFVSPENWIEPELRTDKTPFFKRLEGELMQADVTAEAAEDALRHYLEDLDSVARLEPSGMYHEREETSGSQRSIDILHVIARTTTEPRRHFYRQFVDGGHWTAWEPLDVEIDADHVIPVVHNRRLVVYWPQMLEGADDSPPSQKKDPPPSPTKFTDVKLAWTERRKGKWTPKRVSGRSVRLDMTKDWSSLLSLRAQLDSNGDLLIGGAVYFFGYSQMADTFRISGADGAITLTGQALAAPEAPPPDTFPSFQRFVERRTIDAGWPVTGDQLTLPYQEPLFGAQRTVTTLDATPGDFELVTAHQYRSFESQDVFFFREGGRTFFVQPVPGQVFRGPQIFEPGYAPLAHPDWHEKYFTEVQRDPQWHTPHGGPDDPWIKGSDVFVERSFPAANGIAADDRGHRTGRRTWVPDRRDRAHLGPQDDDGRSRYRRPAGRDDARAVEYDRLHERMGRRRCELRRPTGHGAADVWPDRVGHHHGRDHRHQAREGRDDRHRRPRPRHHREGDRWLLGARLPAALPLRAVLPPARPLVHARAQSDGRPGRPPAQPATGSRVLPGRIL